VTRAERERARLRRALRALDTQLAQYGGAASAQKRQALEGLRAAHIDRARDLLTLQRIVCFLRAFPDDAAVHRTACRLARGFAARVARLPKAERAQLDDSGAAGSCTRHTYVATAARWMARRCGGAVDLDWKADAAADALAALVAPLLDPMEAEVTELDAASLRAWLAQARRGQPGSDLGWLLAQAGGGRARAQFDRTFDAAEVPLAWRLDDRSGITGNAQRLAIVPRDGMRRAAADARAAITQPLDVLRLRRRETTRLLDTWRAALWSRTRTVYQIEQPNLDECWLADFGGGLRFAAIGVAPALRGALEATYGYLLFANGVPIGYGGFTTLFAQVNTGVNVFPEYRGSEAAFAFQQALRAMHAIAGNARFVVNPYQFGAGNDEALASGAYWFYYRLGFRSARAGERTLAEREFARIRADRGYRVPIATLRRLAACDLHLDLADDATERFFDESWLPRLAHGITAAIAAAAPARRADALRALANEVAARLGARLSGWTALEREGLLQFAPILAQIDDLGAWPPADRAALARLLRARWAPQERGFIGLLREHARLRVSLARVAQRRAAAQP